MNKNDKRLLVVSLGLILLYTLSSPATGLYIPGYPGNLVLNVNAIVDENPLSGVPVTLDGTWTKNTPATFDLQPDVTYEVTVPLTKSIDGTLYYFVEWENGWETPIRWISFMIGKAEKTYTAYYSTTDPGPRREPTQLWIGVVSVSEPDYTNYVWIEGLLSSLTVSGGINDRDVKIYERVDGGDWEHIQTVTTESLCINYIDVAVDGGLQYQYQPAVRQKLPRGETMNFEWYLEFEGDDEFAPCTSNVYHPIEFKHTFKWETSLTIQFVDKPSKVGDICKITGQLKGNSTDGYKPLEGKEVYVIRHSASDADPDVLVRKINGPLITDVNGKYIYEETMPPHAYYQKVYEYHATFGAIGVPDGDAWGTDDPEYRSFITGTIKATVEDPEKGGAKSILEAIIAGWIGEDTLASLGGIAGLSNIFLLGIAAIVAIKVLDLLKSRREN